MNQNRRYLINIILIPLSIIGYTVLFSYLSNLIIMDLKEIMLTIHNPILLQIASSLPYFFFGSGYILIIVFYINLINEEE